MEMTLKDVAEILNEDQTVDFPFTLEERQYAAKVSADTWEAILNNTIQPFDFKKQNKAMYQVFISCCTSSNLFKLTFKPTPQ